jgi:hypothetical protein
MILFRKSTLLCCIVFLWGMHLTTASPLRLAVRHTGPPIKWDAAGDFAETDTLPVVVVSTTFPLPSESPARGFPPPHIPVLLQMMLPPDPEPGYPNQQALDSLSRYLTKHSNITHMSLKGWEPVKDLNRLSFIIKRIVSLARGIRPGIRIALQCTEAPENQVDVALYRTLVTSPDISPYFDSLFLSSHSPRANRQIRREIIASAPQTDFWELLCASEDTPSTSHACGRPSRILSCLREHKPFSRTNTSLLVVPTTDGAALYIPLLRFSMYLKKGLYKDAAAITPTFSDGHTSRLPLYFHSEDHSPVLFLEGRGNHSVKIPFKKGLYQKALVLNIITGKEAVFKIRKNSRALLLKPGCDFFALHFIPRKQKASNLRYNVAVTGRARLSAAEIIAGVRAWKSRQKILLKSFIADMSTSMRLRIGNLKETFDLTIKGPLFSERNKPFDWQWTSFYVNGVKWKSKRVPKIPLLQPEKVEIMPLDVSLTEEYRYSLAGETSIKGKRAYIVNFAPRKEHVSTSVYRGRIWVDAESFAIIREYLVQLNLKGEVLSNAETRYYSPVPNQDSQPIRLPLSVIGQQVFSTAGRITNVERKVTLSNIKTNPKNFHEAKASAHRSRSLMVRDTPKGMRYLVKNKKTGERIVEHKTKKSQLFGVLGGFYDRSLSYPIPLLGFNYMNFNLGGKGRQVNVLFGGAMLTANYSDPSFLGSRVNIGANLVAVAFSFKNRIYRYDTATEIETERLKRQPFKLQLNTGFPLGSFLQYSTSLFFEYGKFSKAKTTAEDFILPRSTLTLRWRSRLTFNIKGYRLALWGDIARRTRWDYWGLPGGEHTGHPNHTNHYSDKQRTFYRWQAVLDKDFFLSTFRKIHLTAGYYDGRRLDRFSAYKFGFFSELSLHGYPSGVLQAKQVYMLNLSYGYSIGRAFRLELFYDSALVTYPEYHYRNSYFSGTAISGTMNIPWLKGILRFEAGMPIVGNKIKGFMIYFVLLKMF